MRLSSPRGRRGVSLCERRDVVGANAAVEGGDLLRFVHGKNFVHLLLVPPEADREQTCGRK